MAAYVIAQIHITDPTLYEEYRKLVPPTLEKYGGRFIIRGGKVETLEGNWQPQRLVVLEFESVERAKQWYNSPEYTKAREIRQKASTGNVIMVEGV
ncbi:MAG TPA: DUF1330 domain-containing protein [Candidatus Limnocylindrales bacterium]|nr:DUF1330 domain-containing protein [Candidatus Limnocylindrales bacterium]